MSRLEEIKDRYVDALLNDGYFQDTITITSKDYLWIIQQAELTDQYKKDWLHAVKRSDHYKKTVRTLMEQIDVTQSRDERLQKRVEELEEEINDYKTINKGLHDRRRKCKKQNNRYKQALEFYANIRNYHSELWENTAIEDDCGRIARQILADNHD